MVYQGSKAKYSKYIIPILKKEIEIYKPKCFIDAMVGGANILQHIDNKIIKYGYDLNPYLISLYNYAISENPTFPDSISREDWDKAKNHPEQCDSWFVGLVAFFASYSARGFSGGYALNGTRDFYHERLTNFKKQIPMLKDCIFQTLDFFELNAEHSIIYLDPPYKGTKGYDYSKDFNHTHFWDKVRNLSINNKVFVSEKEAPQDFVSIWSLDTKVNCFNSKSVKSTENLFILEESYNARS